MPEICANLNRVFIVAGPGIPMRIGNSFPPLELFPIEHNWRLETELRFNVHFQTFTLGKRIFCS